MTRPAQCVCHIARPSQDMSFPDKFWSFHQNEQVRVVTRSLYICPLERVARAPYEIAAFLRLTSSIIAKLYCFVSPRKLKEAFGLADINELPISYNIAWYEQKAVIVLLARLNLGVKNIRLGPTLPAFLSPNVTNLLVTKFGIASITIVEDDIKLLG